MFVSQKFEFLPMDQLNNDETEVFQYLLSPEDVLNYTSEDYGSWSVRTICRPNQIDSNQNQILLTFKKKSDETPKHWPIPTVFCRVSQIGKEK